MFAILLNEENLQKIFDLDPTLNETDKHGIEVYINRPQRWYYIRGYVSSRGGVPTTSILPQYTLDKEFEYNPVKIQTDWDLIVRK